jgi:6-phosphogluconate dehydrogenase
MPEAKAVVGVVGLAVMGENLALNIAGKGFRVAVYNRTVEKVDDLHRRAGPLQERIVPCRSMAELAQALARPRKAILLVKAGPAVDAVIQELERVFDRGDVIADSGNSHFLDTERRARELEARGLRFVGMGISGGEEGALHGPSLMPGGSREGFQALEPILTRIAAQVDDGPCTAYMGPGGAGHYVKMVHNGIEYGDMQLIGEVYDLLRTALNPSAKELADLFAEWNRGELRSYLIEITADIFRKLDPESGKPLLELVLDRAGAKGTGKWTSQNALDLGAPIPTITSAVEARALSALKTERTAAAALYGPRRRSSGSVKELRGWARAALYGSKVSAYAQGMALLGAASREHRYGLNLGEIARIWKGGCIIRAALLDRIRAAYQNRADLPNLLVDPGFKEELSAREGGWREAVGAAVRIGVPVPAMSASLAYYDGYRSERLPANLLQAQRDYFGAHTYERVDRPGSFHTDWPAK